LLKSTPSFCQCPVSSTRSALSHNQVLPAPGRCSANGQPTTIESLKISEEIPDAAHATILGTGPASFSHCYPASSYSWSSLFVKNKYSRILLSLQTIHRTLQLHTASSPFLQLSHPAPTFTRRASGVWISADDLLVPSFLQSSLSVIRRGLQPRRQSDNTSNYSRSAVNPPRIQPKITKSPLRVQLQSSGITRQAPRSCAFPNLPPFTLSLTAIFLPAWKNFQRRLFVCVHHCFTFTNGQLSLFTSHHSPIDKHSS
jgi:hypothetical protein